MQNSIASNSRPLRAAAPDGDRAKKPETGRCFFAFDAIGTRWEIDTPEPLTEGLRKRILDRIDRFDVTYSRFRSDSLVSRIAAAPEGGRFVFPDDARALFDLYDRLVALTDGAVDPLVGRDLELLGYDPAYTLAPAPHAVLAGHAETRPTWGGDLRRDGAVLTTHRPLVIDVGAAGKGYLVDIISALLRDAGITRFTVDGSGDLRHAGDHPIRVGLEHPDDPRRVIGVANLRDAALCASAVTRRAWGAGLHHVLDARTGSPVREVVATWAVAPRAAVADALATALFFTRADRLADSFPFTGVRMFTDGRTECFGGFDGTVFTTGRA